MDQRVFKLSILFSLLFACTLATANETIADSCFNNSGSYQVIDCFNKKIETAKIGLDEQRKLLIGKNQKILHGDNRFIQKESNIQKKWLLFANKDCEMRSYHSGEKDSLIYQMFFSQCMLHQYIERTESLKNSLKLLEV